MHGRVSHPIGPADRQLRHVRSFLRGFGQIMLQESAATGLIFLAGIVVNSRWMAVGSVVGAVAGVGCARLLRYESSDVSRGWYGFNGALVGIALLFFHEPGVMSLFLVLVGGALSALLMHAMLGRGDRLPPYTAPFILAAWLMMLIAHAIGVPVGTFAAFPASNDEFFVVARGVGQVMFQDYWISGVLFIVGIAACSVHAAAWAVMGAALGMVAARALGYPSELIAAGLFGFNASLTAIALAGRFRNHALAMLSGIILSVLITRAFQLTPVPSLTAPFVLATWLVIAASWLGRGKRAKPA